MTACVNRKHTKKVAAVVTASLVGALSLGVAPVAAMATDEGIETLTAGDVQDFSNGVVTVVNGGTLVSDNTFTTTATGDTIQVVPNWFQTETGATFRVDENGSGYEIDYVKADEDGEPTDVTTKIKDPGTYYVRITARGNQYDGGVAYMKVVVNAVSFTDPEVFEVDPTSDKNTDKKFVYDGTELELGIEDSGTTLVEGVDYSVKFLEAGDSIDDPGVEVKDAGTYYGVISGMGKYAGKSATLDEFTVDPYALDAVDGVSYRYVDPVIASNVVPEHPTVVTWTDDDGFTTSLDTSLVKLVMVGAPNGDLVFGEKGTYTFQLVPAVEDDTNVVLNDPMNPPTVNVDKYDAEATFGYDGGAWVESMTTDLSAKKPELFAYANVEAYDEDENQLGSSEVSIYVYDASGELVESYVNGVITPGAAATTSAGAWNTVPGTYTVKAVAGASDHTVGGVVVCTVKVTNGTLDADADVYVKYKGEVTTGLEVDWTAAGIKLSDFDVFAKDDDGNDVSSQLAFEVTDSEGNVVKSAITEAGEYTLTVKSDAYDLAGTTTVSITVNKLQLDELKLDDIAEKYGYTYMNMAGKTNRDIKYFMAHTQYLQGVDDDGNGKLDDWTVVPAAELDFDLTYYDTDEGEWVDVNFVPAKTEGLYRLTVSPKTDDAEKNMVFATDEGTVLEFRVLDGSKFYFADVQPDSWYFDAVAAIKKAGYMNGYSDTDLFGPEDSIKRGQVAIVLYNIATNGGKNDETDYEYTEDKGYQTNFNDVDGKLYYAKAISWAEQAGVVNGYEGNFRPEDSVTREEFAAMLANFAKKYNDFDEVDVDAELAEFPDGSSVSDWAKESVAWATSEEIMGNGGSINPASAISRAEAAAMVGNYKGL